MCVCVRSDVWRAKRHHRQHERQPVISEIALNVRQTEKQNANEWESIDELMVRFTINVQFSESLYTLRSYRDDNNHFVCSVLAKDLV